MDGARRHLDSKTTVGRLAILVFAALCVLGFARTSQAQTGVDYGIDLDYDPLAETVYAWAKTTITYADALYYDVCTRASLVQDGTLIAENELCDGWDAVLNWNVQPEGGSVYDFTSEHTVTAYYSVYDWATGQYQPMWYNPYTDSLIAEYLLDAYLATGGDLNTWPYTYAFYMGMFFNPEMGTPPDWFLDLLFSVGIPDRIVWATLGRTLYLPPVSISGLSLPGAERGASGTLTIYGDFIGGNAEVFSATDGTLSLTTISSNEYAVTANFSISPYAATGPYDITVTTPVGSATTPFVVGDPSPSIHWIAPGHFEAGDFADVTIGGLGFGSNPELTISPSTVTAWIVSSTDSEIRAVFDLTTTPPGTYAVSVVSQGIGGLGFVAAQGPATGPVSTPRTFAVGIPVPPRLEVFANGNLISSNQVTLIGADPSNGFQIMPALAANLVAYDGSPLTTGSVQWWATLDQRPTTTDPRARPTLMNVDLPSQGVRQLSAGQPWDISAEMGGAILGGAVAVHALYSEFPTVVFSLNFRIGGTNPSETQIKAELGNSPWFLTRLVRQESSYRQFGSDASPRFGFPDGWGLMQLDPPPDVSVAWDWRSNVEKGKQHLEDKRVGAESAWANRVQAWRAYNASNPAQLVPIHGNVVESSCEFGMDDNGLAAPGTSSFSDAIWIKRYNGASKPRGSGPGGGDYIIWQTQITGQPPGWQLNQTNINNQNYVNLVCSKLP